MYNFKPENKKYQIYNIEDESYDYIYSNDCKYAAEEYAEKYFEKEWEIAEETDIQIKVIELPSNREHIEIYELESEEFSDDVYNFNIWWEPSRTFHAKREFCEL